VVITGNKSTENTNGKNIISSVANKVRSLRSAIANFFAPRDIDEFALAIA